MDGQIWLRILAGLVLLAAIAGIAFFAFNAGVTQGVVTKLPSTATGQPGSGPYPYFGAPFYWHAFPFWGFGFGCFGPLIALFLVLLAFRAMRFAFWGPGWGWRHMEHRAWRHGWSEEGVPPMFKEWHQRAHGETENKD